MTRKKPLPDVEILYSGAAGRCCFPGCRLNLVIESKKEGKKKQIGKIAHIVAHSKKGPRGDSSYPLEKRGTYENWILLCGTHHDIVDAFDSEYTVAELRKMKRNHEDWVHNTLEARVQKTTFAELEVAAKYILSKISVTTKTSFELLPPAKKIRKNNLTASTYNLIVMGISRSREMGKYIEYQSQIDENYPEQLKKGFRTEYDRLIEDGTSGDALFESMLEFSSGYSTDFARRAAGLIILTHLFELCEVFEK